MLIEKHIDFKNPEKNKIRDVGSMKEMKALMRKG